MLRKAIVLSFDAEARTALVEYWGDTERRIESVRVAAHVDAAMLAAGTAVEVWAPAESRPDEALVVASRAALASPDQTIAASHSRLDNVFGPASLASQWFNRIAVPSSPDSHNAEMTEDPAGSNGWTWAASPGGGSGKSFAWYPHNCYVYLSSGSTPDPVELRCTDAGNFPRWKECVVYHWPVTSSAFRFRAAKDANNYTEIEITSAGIKAWKCIASTRTQVGSTVPLYPIPYWLQLSHYPGGNYLTWTWGTVWGPGAALIGTASDAGLQAADITQVSCLFYKGTFTNETFWVDAVRFHT